VLNTVHVNGKFTPGENIGDLGGLNHAYEALKMTKQENPVRRLMALPRTSASFYPGRKLGGATFSPKRRLNKLSLIRTLRASIAL
jgi:hypothetical protein